MAIYPKSDTDHRIPHSKLKKIVAEIFVRCSMSERDADLLAETLVHADLRAGTNALPTMAPWGGLDKIVGINPLSVAIPAQEKGPLVLDFAFGATAIATFEEVEGFKRRVDKIVREVHGSRRADGVDRVLVPGELEASFERAYATEVKPNASNGRTRVLIEPLLSRCWSHDD